MRLQVMILLAGLAGLRPAGAASPNSGLQGIADHGVGRPTVATKAAFPPVAAGDVQDSRAIPSTDSMGLSVDLKLSGPAAKGAVAGRAFVDSARDDTGKSLIGPPPKNRSFTEFGKDPPKLSLNLINPVRRAKYIREIAGKAEIYVPGLDPSAMAVFPDYEQLIGKSLTSPALAGAGVKITAWTAAHYKAYKKAVEKSKDSQRIEGLAVGEGLPLLGAGISAKLRSQLVLRVDDPGSRVVTIEIEGPDGKPEAPSSFSLQMEKPTIALFVFSFYTSDPPQPADSRVRVYVSTPKSVVAVPFRLVHVPLP